MPVFILPLSERSLIATRKAMMETLNRRAKQAQDSAYKVAQKAESRINSMYESHLDEMLQNGGGALCIQRFSLRPADIIVSTTKNWKSWGIRIGTNSSVSHAALYLGQGGIIDATGVGVSRRGLDDLLRDATVGVAFRHRYISNKVAADIVELASSKMASPYDASGAFLAGGLSDVIGDSGVHLQDDSAFYCSELVTWAYYTAGLPIAGVGEKANAPDALPESADLRYIGHLK
ncbi:MAG: hypothetical protein ACE368_15190 [Paracoccaceae bacterium]